MVMQPFFVPLLAGVFDAAFPPVFTVGRSLAGAGVIRLGAGDRGY